MNCYWKFINHIEIWSIQWNKTGFFEAVAVFILLYGCTTRTLTKHKKARWELHKNATCCLEQIPETLSAVAVKYTNCTSADGWPPPPAHKCPRYDTKQTDGEDSVMLELWGMRSTPLLLLLPGPLWPGVVAPDRALSMGQIEVFDI